MNVKAKRVKKQTKRMKEQINICIKFIIINSNLYIKKSSKITKLSNIKEVDSKRKREKTHSEVQKSLHK